MFHFTSTCAIVSPILNPLIRVAQTPSQQVDVSQLPPSRVTPQVATVVHAMQMSQTNHMHTYMKMISQKIPMRRKDLHNRILHSLLSTKKHRSCQHSSTKKSTEVVSILVQKKHGSCQHSSTKKAQPKP